MRRKTNSAMSAAMSEVICVLPVLANSRVSRPDSANGAASGTR